MTWIDAIPPGLRVRLLIAAALLFGYAVMLIGYWLLNNGRRRKTTRESHQ